MKRIVMLGFLAVTIASVSVQAQDDKSKRASPPASVSATTASGNTITINYSQPAVKGRTIGKDIAPYNEVWRTGANEATTIEFSKSVKIQGKQLAAGKYSLYTIPNEKTWTIIFNKTWKQWGTQYTEADDALRVTTNAEKSNDVTERMTFKVAKDGKITLMWGNTKVSFTAS